MIGLISLGAPDHDRCTKMTHRDLIPPIFRLRFEKRAEWIQWRMRDGQIRAGNRPVFTIDLFI